ncbi:MAG: insulinase family protein [Holophagaceae bacterium]|nr:insulinase family protein [Holophagaceae bacterium]
MRLVLAAWLLALPLAAQPTGIQSFHLPNGLRVLFLENHRHPLIRLQLRSTWAPRDFSEPSPSPETKGKVPEGPMPLEPLALGLLDRCSVGNRSRAAFNRTLEERGLSLRLSGEPDGPVWNLDGGSPEAESAFSLLADATTRPIPDGGDLDGQRLRLIHALQEPGGHAAARQEFLRLLERPDLPLEPLTEKGLGQIHLEALQRSISATLRPGRAVLAISGDLNLSQARQLAQTNFGTWNGGSGKDALSSLPSAVPTVSTKGVKRPRTLVASDRMETIIALPARVTAVPQRAAQELLSLWLPRRLGPDRCRIYLGAAGWRSLILAADASEASLRAELSAVAGSGLETKELEQAKALWIADRRALALHPQDQLSLAAKETLLGAGPSEQDIRGVGLAGFNAALRSWLDLDAARILVFEGGRAPGTKTE